MSKQPTSARNPASGAHTRQGRRFPISPVGWVGIAAALVGIAYFALPDGAPEPASERKPPPEARVEVPETKKGELSAPEAAKKEDVTARPPAKKEEGTATRDARARDEQKSDAAPVTADASVLPGAGAPEAPRAAGKTR
jgi:hypothetical protein